MRKKFKKTANILSFMIVFVIMSELFCFVSFGADNKVYNRKYNFTISTEKSNAKNDYSSNEEIKKAAEDLYSKYIKDIDSRSEELSSGKITIEKTTMQLSLQTIGEPDKDGYPLYICLHGGGVEDKKIADEQYEIMKNCYHTSIKNGLYVVPHSIKSRFDEHYLPKSFIFYDRIIEDAVAFHNADPNRVYIIGFSSGGDGVYAIAPRYADRLAAANMSAGFPSVHRLENLYNLPMCIQMGENDDAFERNTHAAEYDEWLNDCKKKYDGGFTHDVFIHKDGTHNQNWSDEADYPQSVVSEDSISAWLKKPSSAKYVSKVTNAISWLNQYERNPLPNKVVWSTDEYADMRRSKAFYWLDRDGLLDNAVVVAS